MSIWILIKYLQQVLTADQIVKMKIYSVFKPKKTIQKKNTEGKKEPRRCSRTVSIERKKKSKTAVLFGNPQRLFSNVNYL